MKRWSFVALVVFAAACGPESFEPGIHEEALGTQQCPEEVVEGIDVYDGKGTIAWNSVATSGIGFAIMKASQGDYNTQTTFAANWSGAHAAGLVRGAYHFFDPTIDGITQANHFLDVLAQNGGLQPSDLPPMVDLECPTAATAGASRSNCEKTGDSGWVDNATLSQRFIEYLDTIEQATGRKPMIYSYVYWFSDLSFTDAVLATHPLVIASYNSCATVPPPWTAATFWQYSDTGTVPGISGSVDLDRYFGSAAELQQFIASSQPTPDAATAADASIVDDQASSATPDLAAGKQEQSGCKCSFGSRAPTNGGLFALLCGLFVLAYRQRLRAGRCRNPGRCAKPRIDFGIF